MDVIAHNRAAWNKESTSGSRWSEPVGKQVIEDAKRGVWEVILTPNIPVPADWFGDLNGKRVLCLASGGGQQAPVLAAAGASVVSFDNSDEQLGKDAAVAKEYGLALETVRGDMGVLSVFGDGGFDLIFHPVSNVFVPDLNPVWGECRRVLQPGGALLAGFMNPSFFLFDHDEAEQTGELVVRRSLPYSDLEQMEEQKRNELVREQVPLEFGHSLEEQIGGQLRAGFVLTGFYEDWWDDATTPLNRFSPTSIATRGVSGGVV